VCVAAVKALRPIVIGNSLEDIMADFAGLWRKMTSDGQLRWLGPEKGAIHLATSAIVNAIWDLYAKTEGKPIWKLLVDMDPKQLVSTIDFRYLGDVLTPEEAVDILRSKRSTCAAREAEMMEQGYPAYTTSGGWLGYPDDKLRKLCREALEAGWTCFKNKVGSDIDDDLRRASIVREEIGPDRTLMFDANQHWEVHEAIASMNRLARFNPLWIEEPTSPDDILGHAAIAKAIAPIGVATGEHCQNRVIFKQLFQADAIAFCQVDICRVGGLNEVLAIMLMAAKFGVPICPHGGGVGLGEYGQHISIFDFIGVSGSLDNRILEYADPIHEHFVDSVRIEGGRYMTPTTPGFSSTMYPESLDEFEFPTGLAWRDAG
jgi:L-fuconate dehydratase